ncbi:ubinuclein-2-like isoform X3 [Halichondria panicea]|uniref:ubinuclein-2-like isoform X3 n=1 Tax=Halichondria panicea TaxID=6063 RepID=UPI00312BCBE4
MAVVNGDHKKISKKERTSHRFDLELVSPTQDSFSEFSYLQMVRERKKEVNSTMSGWKTQKLSISSSSLLNDTSFSGLSGLNASGSSQQMASITRKLEEKYRSKPSKKRKRIIHDSDYIDRGCGYDLDDPFVDDSEFYEDFVPDNVDTKFGGFYVNTGELEFKAAEDINDIDFVVKKKPKITKQPSHQTPQAILASQKLKKAKQHAALHKAPSGTKKLLFTTATSSQVSIKPPPPKKPRKKLHTEPAKQALSKYPAVPISIGEKSVSVLIFPTAAEGPITSSDTIQGVPSISSQVKKEKIVEKPPPVLPSSLPQPVLDTVTKLAMKVIADQAEGKVTNRQREVYNEILLKVESACKSLQMKTRNAVFEYLAHRLGVARGTLTKRMKQLAKKKEDDALEGPILNLKQAIELSMPKQLTLYEEELNKARSESTSSLIDKSTEVDEDTRTDDVFDESSLLPVPVSQFSGGQAFTGQVPSNQSVSGQVEGVTTKQKRLPRKKYRWAENDEVKRLLSEVVRVKVHSEETFSRLNKEKGEDVINQFLEDKIRLLWPKGWMQKSILYKITEPIHKSYTTPLPKKGIPTIRKEKQPCATVKKQASLSGIPQQPKKVSYSQSSPSMDTLSTTASTVSPRLMGVVQNMLTTNHDINSVERMISNASQAVVEKHQQTLSLSSSQTAAKAIGSLPQTIMSGGQLASYPEATRIIGKNPTVFSMSNLKSVKTGSSIVHPLMATKPIPAVILAQPVVSITKVSQDPPKVPPVQTVSAPRLQHFKVSQIGASSSLTPLSHSQTSTLLLTAQAQSAFLKSKIPTSTVPKSAIGTPTSAKTSIPEVFASGPQVHFPIETPHILSANPSAGTFQSHVSRVHPTTVFSHQLNTCPQQSQPQTLMSPPKIKPNKMPCIQNGPLSNQIFQEHCYLKTDSGVGVGVGATARSSGASSVKLDQEMPS